MLQPQAPELEETILGACLIEKEGMALVDELLKPEMFYVTRHQLIYAALQAMVSSPERVSSLLNPTIISLRMYFWCTMRA